MNYGILIIGIIAGLLVLEASGRKNEQKYWTERAKQANPPEHEMVDNQASMSAWAWAVLIAIVASFLFVGLGGAH